jgi:small subunit ribosomal protein S16
MVKLNEELTIAWLQKGAQPTETVRTLLRGKGLLAKAKQA